jgi:hypothetical protein
MCFGSNLFPIFHFTGLETFELPDSRSFGLILLVAQLGMLFNALSPQGIAFSAPLTATVGILLSIPITSFIDWFCLAFRSVSMSGLVGFAYS